jgi:hypothetical protein
VRAELYRPDDPSAVAAVATWSSAGSSLEVQDDSVRDLERLLRPTPVVVDDAALRHLGAHGESVLQPGSVDWFRAALVARAPSLGLAVRFVAEDVRNGWDPAANYRTFEDQSRRIASE